MDKPIEETERREYVRMVIPLSVRLKILDKGDLVDSDMVKEGKVCNISMSGACLELDPPSKISNTRSFDSLFEFKNRVSMEIELFNEFQTIEIVADSNWYHIKGKGKKKRLYVGVSFMEMSRKDYKVLEYFISSVESGAFFMKNVTENSLPV